MNLTFRTIPEHRDIQRVREIVDSTGFFYHFETDIAAELVEERVKGGPETGYHFVFVEVDGVTAAYSCFGHIDMTKSCFDLYWIAVHNDFRGKGIGKKLLEETYNEARALGCTKIIAETSGRDQYKPTQAFYDSAGYLLEAVIKDYYDIGDDKLIYTKYL